MNRYLAKLASLDEKRAYPSNPQNPQNPAQRRFEGFEGSPSSAFLQSATSPTELLAGPYASALAALRAKCPPYVPEDRWRHAVADATTFTTKWGAEAQASGWTAPEWFGLHPVPEQPAPNYDRLARLDDVGLIWLLRGRPVTVLTSTEAVILCHSGATLKFYRRTAPAAEIIDGAVARCRPTEAPLAQTINTMAQIGKPTPVGIIDAAKQGLGDAPKPARRNADAATHAEATHLIPEDLSIPEFLRREPAQSAAQVVKAAPISKPTPVRIIDAVAIATRDPANASGGVPLARSASDAPKSTLGRSTDRQRAHVDGALGHRTDDLLTTATPTPEAAP
jgi:hypothetical protein